MVNPNKLASSTPISTFMTGNHSARSTSSGWLQSLIRSIIQTSFLEQSKWQQEKVSILQNDQQQMNTDIYTYISQRLAGSWTIEILNNSAFSSGLCMFMIWDLFSLFSDNQRHSNLSFSLTPVFPSSVFFDYTDRAPIFPTFYPKVNSVQIFTWNLSIIKLWFENYKQPYCFSCLKWRTKASYLLRHIILRFALTMPLEITELHKIKFLVQEEVNKKYPCVTCTNSYSEKKLMTEFRFCQSNFYCQLFFWPSYLFFFYQKASMLSASTRHHPREVVQKLQ